MIDRREASGMTALAGIFAQHPAQAVDTNCGNCPKTSDLIAQNPRAGALRLAWLPNSAHHFQTMVGSVLRSTLSHAWSAAVAVPE
jgi:hypothetical protein